MLRLAQALTLTNGRIHLRLCGIRRSEFELTRFGRLVSFCSTKVHNVNLEVAVGIASCVNPWETGDPLDHWFLAPF
jgi:hypothetical protein